MLPDIKYPSFKTFRQKEAISGKKSENTVIASFQLFSMLHRVVLTFSLVLACIWAPPLETFRQKAWKTAKLVVFGPILGPILTHSGP